MHESSRYICITKFGVSRNRKRRRRDSARYGMADLIANVKITQLLKVGYNTIEQNRSTEGCPKLKRSVDI